MRNLIRIVENQSRVSEIVIDKAAKLARRLSWSEDGALDVFNTLRDAGYVGPEYNVDTPEFTEAFVKWSKDEVEASLDEITQLFKNDKLRVWREITAPVDWKPSGHPGLYWSWEKDAAEAHWGDGEGVKWLLEATVTFDQIDWVETLGRNASTSYNDEKEIRVLASADVKLEHWGRVR